MTEIGGSEARWPRVFVSYAREDAAFVLDLVQRLKMRGLHIWIDQVELLIGDSLIERIGDAIQGGDFVVAVLSQHSIDSPWCRKELQLAATRGLSENRVIVLPIRLGDVPIPSFLADALYARSDDPSGLADEVTAAITGHLERLRSEGLLPRSMDGVVTLHDGFLRMLGIDGVPEPLREFVAETFGAEIFDRTMERVLEQMDEAQLDRFDAAFDLDRDPDEVAVVNWLQLNVPAFGALWQEEAAGVMLEYKEFAARDGADPDAWARQIAEQARVRRERMDGWFAAEQE